MCVANGRASAASTIESDILEFLAKPYIEIGVPSRNLASLGTSDTQKCRVFLVELQHYEKMLVGGVLVYVTCTELKHGDREETTSSAGWNTWKIIVSEGFSSSTL